MNIEKNYILGVCETTLDFYNELNKPIDEDKEVSFSTESIVNNNKNNFVMGCKLTIGWFNTIEKDEPELKSFNIYSKDKLKDVISDISSILSEINSDSIEFKKDKNVRPW